jgi:hypothetical protein
MVRKPFYLWAGALCALLPFFAAAARADDPKPVTIAATPKAGDSVRYKSTMKISVNGMDITVEQNRKHVVKEVKDNKDVVLVVEEEGGKVDLGGGGARTFPLDRRRLSRSTRRTRFSPTSLRRKTTPIFPLRPSTYSLSSIALFCPTSRSRRATHGRRKWTTRR